MSNLETLKAAGVVPEYHTLNDEDAAVIDSLSDAEVQSLIGLKQKLGDEFLQRNSGNTANCFL